MEHINYGSVAKHLETHDILNDAQHGFRKNRSCESQLLLKIQDLAKGIDRDEQIDISCLTFRRHLIKPPPPHPTRDYFTKLSTMASAGRFFGVLRTF